MPDGFSTIAHFITKLTVALEIAFGDLIECFHLLDNSEHALMAILRKWQTLVVFFDEKGIMISWFGCPNGNCFASD